MSAPRNPVISGRQHEITEAFLEVERHCSRNPADFQSRQRMLQLFVAAKQPDDLPGSSHRFTGSTRPRVAVLTPYYREPLALLERCHRSVARQTFPCHHVLVADGHARDEVDRWPVTHIRLPSPSENTGDTPRRIAGEAAIEARFDAVVYLDADNWFRSRHVESLVECHRATNAPICHSARTMHRPDRSLMRLLQRGDNTEHVDTNCLFVAREAFELLPLWGSWPRSLSPIGDRMLWQCALARGIGHVFTGAITSCYEATHVCFYAAIREEPPPGTRPDWDLAGLVRWYRGLGLPEKEPLDRRFPFLASMIERLALLGPRHDDQR